MPEKINKPTQHPVTVKGYSGSLQSLSEDIHNMRYDLVQAFYQNAVKSIHKQAKKDRKAGRKRLASELRKVKKTLEKLQKHFGVIFFFCEKRMEGGIGEELLR